MKSRRCGFCDRSYGEGKMASNPRKIASGKIMDEVVCQCEYADRSVPSHIIRIVMDGLIREAKKADRTDLVQELEERWKPYSNNNPQDGKAPASIGAQLVMA